MQKMRIRGKTIFVWTLMVLIVVLTINAIRKSFRPHESPIVDQLDNALDKAESGISKFTSNRDELVTQACPDPSDHGCTDFMNNLADVAGLFQRRIIVLALVDDYYLDIAINFYEMSIEPNGLWKNLLFVSLSDSACMTMDEAGIKCVVYKKIDLGKHETIYGSEAFHKKVNLRAEVISKALLGGFTILYSDLDVIFQEDPLPYFTCEDCDLEAMVDEHDHIDPGFILLRPTDSTLDMYARRLELASKSPDLADMSALNCAVQEFADQLDIIKLDIKFFVTGSDYFQREHQFFGTNECVDCVVVHNNFVSSKTDKIYRFKEKKMWIYDEDGYYSDPNARYLTFENNLMFDENTQEYEKRALINAMAIGQLLNRIVIFPMFFCGDVLCHFNQLYDIDTFDDVFKGLYRESTFLDNPRVPQTILKNRTEHHLKIRTGVGRLAAPVEITRIFKPADSENGATSEEVLEYFVPYNHIAILRFHSLYEAFSKFINEKDQKEFDEKVKRAFKQASPPTGIDATLQCPK